MGEKEQEEPATNVPYSERMVTYTGTKTIKATPMTKAEYLDYRGWNLPDGEDPEEEIYLVEYEVDPKSEPNHKNHEGYISMSPKHVFDKAYKVCETYMDRLKIEESDLDDKVTKLKTALFEKTVPEKSMEILKGQLRVMTEYLDILNQRISK